MVMILQNPASANCQQNFCKTQSCDHWTLQTAVNAAMLSSAQSSVMFA